MDKHKKIKLDEHFNYLTF